MTRAILLPVGRNWYALPPVALQEVVADPDVTELPAAPATVRGLFNVRGQILPCWTPAPCWGWSGRPAARSRSWSGPSTARPGWP